MKVYKLEVLIMDEDVESKEDAFNLINETRYANHTHVEALTCREVEVEDFDNSPLNMINPNLCIAEMDRLFPFDRQKESNK